MKPAMLVILSFAAFPNLYSQMTSYADSINAHRESYVKNHGAVKGADKKHLLFFPADQNYRVSASVERIYEAPWFKMETSGKERKVYRVYAILAFKLQDITCKLYVYQSQQLMELKEYAKHLFIPFTDISTGEESYENGRYLDMTIDDLEKGHYVIDFNLAYNPYCAYVSNVYNCPLPPKENNLSVPIRAGEKKFGKSH